MKRDVRAGADMVLHVGDVSYANGDPAIWDSFMDGIEPIASRVPYMIAVGAACSAASPHPLDCLDGVQHVHVAHPRAWLPYFLHRRSYSLVPYFVAVCFTWRRWHMAPTWIKKEEGNKAFSFLCHAPHLAAPSHGRRPGFGGAPVPQWRFWRLPS